jgi:argininosuccinate lyase
MTTGTTAGMTAGEDTGMLHATLLPEAYDIVTAPHVEAALREDLGLATEIDRAHVVMLAERGVLPTGAAAAILDEIARLRASDFAPLRGRPAPRGWYLMYEAYLIATLGAEVGGNIQLGRSRNDYNATLFRLKLRQPYHRLVCEAFRLQACLLRFARRHGELVMPGFTHSQPAVPITYGHYLAAVATELDDDLAALVGWADELDRSPLGAGAVGGTSVPIDSQRTADLLGFACPIANSITAVASRDFAVRLLSHCVVIGALISRVATDLLHWTTAQGLLELPDVLAGSSSMMPQKRNPFVLEHVQGLAAAPLGVYVTAVTAMHKAPYTNSIAVHTEGVRAIWDALLRTTETMTLLRLVIANARPRPDQMRRRAEEGFTVATEMANRLTFDGEFCFRDAHAEVGRRVAAAMDTGSALVGAPEPAEVVAATEYGGGPGRKSRAVNVDALNAARASRLRQFGGRSRRWHEARQHLCAAVRALGAAQ